MALPANHATGQTITAADVNAIETAVNALNGTSLPSQGGNAGKYLSTDGTNPLWALVSGGGGTATIDPTGGALARIPQARTGVFRVLMAGTSITSFDRSVNQVFVAHLKRLYGSRREFVQLGSLLGGDYVSPSNGWTKQPFGGITTGRARGESTSTDLTFDVYGDTVVVEYSKETDGGSWDVQIDGVTAGTINSNGTQAYAQQASFTTTLGPHRVTLKKPASGYAYLEVFRMYDSTRPGVAVIDGNKGGSNLANTQTLASSSASGPTAGIAVTGNNGIDGIFGRTDVDLYICDHLVNDVGSTLATFQAQVDRVVADTAATNTPVLWLIDPAGHFALSGDSQASKYAAFKAYILTVAAAWPHVFAFDWDALTRLADVNAYAAKYYTGVTVTNAGAGTYTGDFIHPNVDAMRVGTAGLCSLVGLPPPAYDLLSTYSLADDSAPLATAVPVRTNPLLPAARTLSAPVGTAVKLVPGGSRPVPLYADESMIDYGTQQAAILASGTSDVYGTYLTYSNAGVAPVQGVMPTGSDRMTFTITATGTLDLRTLGSTWAFYADGVAIPKDTLGRSQFTYVGGSTPYTVMIEYSATDIASLAMTVTGKVYEWRASRQTARAILARKSFTSLHQIGPEIRLDNDQAFDPDLIGQSFYEVIGGSVITRKKLVSYGEKWDFTAQAPSATRVGVYEALDRTTSGLKVARQFGTPTQSASGYLGGGGEEATSNSGILTATAFGINVSGKATALVRPAVGNYGGVRIAFQNGGTLRYLTPAGAWASSSTAVRTATFPLVPGENYVFTFDLPTGTDLTALGNTPDFRVEWQGAAASQPMSTATCVRGQSACV